jgi:hypothetical protein
MSDCKCRQCKPVLDGIRADVSPPHSVPVAPSEKPTNALPLGSAARKDIPLARGVLDYFPAALAAVAELSRKGNEKHNLTRHKWTEADDRLILETVSQFGPNRDQLAATLGLPLTSVNSYVTGALR